VIRRRWFLLACTALLVLEGCGFPGQRLLNAEIQKDGQPVLRTQFSVPDSWNRQQAWQRLQEQSFDRPGEWKPEPDDAKQVVLRGKVRVILLHAGKEFAAAEVAELRLVADPNKEGSWQLAPAEAERTGKALK
jgi:hypothetical protein